MDDNLKFALTLVAGAAGGAIVAGGFALIGAWIANKREHRRWILDLKYKLYVQTLSDFEKTEWIISVQPRDNATWLELTEDIQRTRHTPKMLISSSSVSSGMKAVQVTLADMIVKPRGDPEEFRSEYLLAMANLMSDMKRDLNIGGKKSKILVSTSHTPTQD